ncbi:MAG: C39 family peptidase [Pseudomonadota bacterium]
MTRAWVKRLLMLVVLAGGALVFGGCSNLAGHAADGLLYPVADFEPAQAAGDVVFIPVAFIRQPHELLCGPTSLAMVMAYYGYTGNDEYLDQWSRRPKRVVKFRELAHDAKDRGFDASLVQSSEEQLRRWLDQGCPVVVLFPQPWGVDHMMVAVGYSRARDFWILCDPSRGFRKMPAPRFNTRWAERLRAAMLVLPAKPSRNAAKPDWTGRPD